MSQPTRAAWIEIFWLLLVNNYKNASQPTRAAWIEIVKVGDGWKVISRRSPLGLRGLK